MELFITRYGDTAAVLEVRLSDSKGARDLSGSTVTLTLIDRMTRDVILDKVACVVDIDQVENKGVVRHQFSASDYTALENKDNDYEAIFYETNGLADRNSYPKEPKKQPFFIVRVERDDGAL